MPQRVWANLDFPSHFAAITYFEKAVTDHVQRCSPEAVSTWAPSLFVQKSRQVVPEGRLLLWLAEQRRFFHGYIRILWGPEMVGREPLATLRGHFPSHGRK